MIADIQLERLKEISETTDVPSRMIREMAYELIKRREAGYSVLPELIAKIEALLRREEGMSTHAIKEQHVQWNAGVNAALKILRGEK